MAELSRAAFEALQEAGRAKRRKAKPVEGPVISRGMGRGGKEFRAPGIMPGEEPQRKLELDRFAPPATVAPETRKGGGWRDRVASALYGATAAMAGPSVPGETEWGAGIMRGVRGTAAVAERGQLARAAEARLAGEEERKRELARYKASLRETPEEAARRAEAVARARQPTEIEKARVMAGIGVEKAKALREAEEKLTEKQKKDYRARIASDVYGDIMVPPAQKEAEIERRYYRLLLPEMKGEY